MKVHPQFSEFQEHAREGNIVPVYTDLMADFETPVSAYAKLSREKPSFLFESIEGGEHLSRYTFIGFGPRKILTAWPDKTCTSRMLPDLGDLISDSIFMASITISVWLALTSSPVFTSRRRIFPGVGASTTCPTAPEPC